MKRVSVIFLMVAIVIISAVTMFFIFKDEIKKKSVITKQTEGVLQNDEQEMILENIPELEKQERVGEIIARKDFLGCELVQDEMYKKVCINNIAMNLAKEKQDISYCEKMDNELIPRDDCERQVIFQKSIDRENEVVCDEAAAVDVRMQCRDSFLLSLALKKNDKTVCNRESGADRKNICLNTYLFQKEYVVNPGMFDCGLFIGDAIRKDCQLFNEKKIRVIESGVCDSLQSDLFLSYCMTRQMR